MENNEKRKVHAERKLAIAFWVNNIYSTLYLVLAWIQFFNSTLHSAITSFAVYVFVNSFYSVYKGILRRRYDRIEQNRGEWWVIVWLISTLIMVSIEFFTKYSTNWQTIGLFGVVLANYCVTEIEKLTYEKNHPEKAK